MARPGRGRRPNPALDPPPAEAQAVLEKVAPTDEEAELGFVYQLLVRGVSTQTLYAAVRAQYGYGRDRANVLARRVRESLKSEADERRPFARSEQIGRLRSLIAELRQPKTREVTRMKGGKKVTEQVALPLPANAILRAEELLADVEGNVAPIKVDVEVTVTAKLQNVFSTMTPERAAFLLERARERRRLAAAAKDAIDAQGAEVT